ncbi:MAG: DUF58 domain-containing protein, partial [Lachnospiraceae bacterium]|nr:DUF58 domain-containing protein [Lachnospiraceae bacterium]
MIQILLIVFLLTGLFLLQSKLYQFRWNHALNVKISFLSSEIYEKEVGTLQVVVENAKKLPLPMLMVKFQTDKHLEFEGGKNGVTTDQFYHNDIFHVGSGERVIRNLSFLGKRRGYFRINNIDMSATDLFMYAQFFGSFKPKEDGIYVLPRPYESKDFQLMLQQLNGQMITKRNLYEDPFELRGIREYQPYDDMRSINWKATAKTGSFMVNQKNYTAPKTVRIFLNLEDERILKKEECLEDCIRIGSGLAKYLLEQGVKVSFYCNAPDILTGDPMMKAVGSGKNQMSAIMRSLARLDTGKQAIPFAKLF